MSESEIEIIATTRPARGLGPIVVIGTSAAVAVLFVIWAFIEYAGAARAEPLGVAIGGAFLALAVLCLAVARVCFAFRTAAEPRPSVIPPSEHAVSDPRASRRAAAVLFGTIVAIATLVWLPIRSLFPRRPRIRPSRWRAGLRVVDENGDPFGHGRAIASGTTIYPQDAVGDPRSIALLTTAGARLRAFSVICTHAGCALRPSSDGRSLVCPCHASRFSVAEDGRRIAGPAAKRLPMLPLARDELGYLVAAGDFDAPPGPTEG